MYENKVPPLDVPDRDWSRIRSDIGVSFVSGADAVARLASNALVGRDDYWYQQAIERLADLRSMCLGLADDCERMEESHDVR